MGLFDQISGMLGGPQQAQQQIDRYAQGQATMHDPQSPDFQNWNQMIGAAPPQVTQEVFTQAAQQVDPQDYYNHITPGVGGTDPLGGLSQGALGSLAGTLMGALAGGGMGGGMGGGGLGNVTQLIPGLRTTNPNHMSPQEVAAMANYMRQNHPEQFGQAAAQIAQQQPGILQQLMGNKALMLAAAGIGAKILSDRAAQNHAGMRR